MKIIEPQVKEITDFVGVDNFYKSVARAARICYASDKTTDDKELCQRLIEQGHFSPLEHAVILIDPFPYYEEKVMQTIWDNMWANKYFLSCHENDEFQCYATNGRVIIEAIINYVKDAKNDIPIINLLDHVLRSLKKFEVFMSNRFKSFIVDTSIGCTREMNRHHNNFYICEQSTRYCNFSKDKFGNEVSFNKPYWYDDDPVVQSIWKKRMWETEIVYLGMLKAGIPTDIARGVLPLDTHTRAIYTATIEEWKHIISLRYDGKTGKPHGDIKVIVGKIKELIENERK